jgi:hypothetical protein
MMSSPRPIDRASPTLVEELRRCSLAVAFARTGHASSVGNPWSRLGTVCHQLYEAAALGRLGDGGPTFDARFDETWHLEMAAQEADALASDAERHWGPAPSWPTYSEKRVRMRRRSRELAQEASQWAGGDARVEEFLAPDDDILFGRPDLIVRSPAPYRVIDYKTGVIDDAGTLKGSYRRQLLTYAYLENKVSGGRPSIAIAVPLKGDAISFEIDWDEVSVVADDAHWLVDRFNKLRTTPTLLATPSEAACGACPHAARCDVFWDALDQFPNLVAIAGTVTKVVRTHGNTATLTISARQATLGCDTVHLQRLSLLRFPQLSGVDQGSPIKVVGGRRVGDTGTVMPTLTTRVTVG